MEDEWVGRTFNDRYEILELLGTGGMSSVYKANDPNLDRVVAIKIIHPHLSVNEEFIRRFRTEAQSVAQLRHPNIVQVFDFDSSDGTAYIVFEFVPGENLQERLERMSESGRLMSPEEVISISSQISSALDYAHGQGLVHRDVKPANIILDVHGNALLADFGIVKITDDIQHTATGAVIGTARYMSPEQIKGQSLDGRTDIYSLGVAMFEMSSGELPYTADSAMTIMMMHVNDPIPDMDVAGIEGTLGEVISRALAKLPDDRFASAGELVAALADPSYTAPDPDAPAAVDTGSGSTADDTAAAAPVAGDTGGRRRLYAMAGGALAVAALIVVLVVWAFPGDDEPNAAPAPDPGASSETVAITGIGVSDGSYIVDYETFGYTEEITGLHVHFYWNDIEDYEAGMGPYEQDWFVWGGPRPFDGYLVADRPDGATEMCAVVANADHTVVTGTGNCMALP